MKTSSNLSSKSLSASLDEFSKASLASKVSFSNLDDATVTRIKSKQLKMMRRDKAEESVDEHFQLTSSASSGDWVLFDLSDILAWSELRHFLASLPDDGLVNPSESYDPVLHSNAQLGICTRGLGQGSERVCHLMALYHEGRPFKKLTVKQSRQIDDRNAKTRVDTVEFHENFRAIYFEAQLCADAFNKRVTGLCLPEKVATIEFVRTSILTIFGRAIAGLWPNACLLDDRDKSFLVEPLLGRTSGEPWVKWNNNDGAVKLHEVIESEEEVRLRQVKEGEEQLIFAAAAAAKAEADATAAAAAFGVFTNVAGKLEGMMEEEDEEESDEGDEESDDDDEEESGDEAVDGEEAGSKDDESSRIDVLEVPQAFSHFSHEHGDHKKMIVDIQVRAQQAERANRGA